MRAIESYLHHVTLPSHPVPSRPLTPVTHVGGPRTCPGGGGGGTSGAGWAGAGVAEAHHARLRAVCW